jgi:hypothetical protein
MSPCGWTVTTCGCGTCWDSYTDDVRSRAESLAAMVMWAATGRQFGLCSVTVQPQVRHELLPGYQTFPVAYEGFDNGPYIEHGQWKEDCSGQDSVCWTGAGTCGALLNGPTKTSQVTSVKVDSVALPAGSFVVVDGDTLVRTDGVCWPTCTNVAQQSPPAFEVTYQVGNPIPAAVQAAFETLACEYAKVCAGGKCSLPQTMRTLTRQGVEVTVAEVPEDGRRFRTGIKVVDAVIAAVNPAGLSRRPMVYSPDMPRPVVVS